MKPFYKEVISAQMPASIYIDRFYETIKAAKTIDNSETDINQVKDVVEYKKDNVIIKADFRNQDLVEAEVITEPTSTGDPENKEMVEFILKGNQLFVHAYCLKFNEIFLINMANPGKIIPII